MQRNGLSSQIYSLLNNEEFRPTTNLVISTCDAYDYLNNVRPNLEKLTTNYYETFSITNKFTGYFSNITVGEFFNTLSAKDCDGTAILGGLDETARKEKEKNLVNLQITEVLQAVPVIVLLLIILIANLVLQKALILVLQKQEIQVYQML